MEILSTRFLSVVLLALSIFVVTWVDKSGCTRSKRDQGWRPINRIASNLPVVDCGNKRYWTNTRNNRVSKSPVTFLSPLLMVCTARLASPFEEGWYCVHLTCLMPFRAQNLENSLLVKLLALSDTITCGLPCVANVRLNILSVTEEDGDDTTYAFIYLLWVSTIIKIYLLWIGPALSMCTRNQGLLGHSHGCNALAWGIFALSWHMTQLLTHNSISASILGHQIWLRARDFIREIPGWLSCNSFSKASRHFAGITTRDLHKTQPSCSDNSSFLVVYGWKSRDLFPVIHARSIYALVITRDLLMCKKQQFLTWLVLSLKLT